MTRYFGELTREFQTDVSTLARVITGAGIKMEYILFDDCYMSSVEVAYELKEATRFLIASTSEMMAYGMPYATVGSSCWEVLIMVPFAKDSMTFIQPTK